MAEVQNAYPATLSIDYPDRPLNRLTTFFRLVTIIPIFIILLFIGFTGGSSGGNEGWGYQGGGAAIVFLPIMFMLLFRQKYPRWWFDQNLAITRFSTRIGAYFLLLRDEYPSTDEEQAVHLDIIYPDAKEDLTRWMPLVKWFLAIPHYIILIVLFNAVFVSVIIAWFAILFTSMYPRGLFDFIVSVSRWGLRVAAYAFLLTTDRYPPFALSE